MIAMGIGIEIGTGTGTGIETGIGIETETGDVVVVDGIEMSLAVAVEAIPMVIEIVTEIDEVNLTMPRAATVLALALALVQAARPVVAMGVEVMTMAQRARNHDPLLWQLMLNCTFHTTLPYPTLPYTIQHTYYHQQLP